MTEYTVSWSLPKIMEHLCLALGAFTPQILPGSLWANLVYRQGIAHETKQMSKSQAHILMELFFGIHRFTGIATAISEAEPSCTRHCSSSGGLWLFWSRCLAILIGSVHYFPWNTILQWGTVPAEAYSTTGRMYSALGEYFINNGTAYYRYQFFQKHICSCRFIMCNN